jgi:hypothetical protein
MAFDIVLGAIIVALIFAPRLLPQRTRLLNGFRDRIGLRPKRPDDSEPDTDEK